MKDIMKEFYKKANGGHEYFTSFGNDNNGEYKFIHITESNDDEYIITAKLIIPKKSKIVEKCLKSNKSPIRQILEKIEKQNNNELKDEKTENRLYNFPDWYKIKHLKKHRSHSKRL